MIRRRILIAVASLAAILLLSGVAGILVLQSAWLHEKVRQTIVTTLETATGGRAEVGSFRFDWKQMRFEIHGFALRGTEPAGKPPFVSASSVAAGLRITSLLHLTGDVRYLDVQDPHVYLIVYPGGRTNVPEPRVKRRGEQTPFDTLVNFAIGRFSLVNGMFEVESGAKTPFSVRGRNLSAGLVYEAAGTHYRGNLSVQPLDLEWGGPMPIPLGVQLALTLENDRIDVTSGRLTNGDSTVDFSGALEHLIAPRAAFRYRARVSAGDASRLLRIPGLEHGTLQLAGSANWDGASNYSLAGALSLSAVEFQRASWRLRNLRMEGALRVNADGAELNGFRFSGESVRGGVRIPVQGQATTATLRGKSLNVYALKLDALGGSFTGEGELANYDRFQVHGVLSGLDARSSVGLYSRQPLPWDSLVSGPVRIEGSARRPEDLRISADLTLAPAAQGPPVRGQIAATYDARSGALDLSPSTVALPSSRLELSGAISRQLRVRLETRDLNDFLPVLGDNASSMPVRLENGSASFDGTVSGQIQNPRIAGRLALTRFTYAGKSFDALQADISASPQQVRLQNADLARGAGRAQFQLAVGLRDWRVDDSSSLAGSGALRNAAVADLLTLANEANGLATGIASATGQIAGTIGDPQFSGDVEVARGSFHGEPFDRFAARVTGSRRALQVTSGQLGAGTKQILLDASFDHAPNRFDTGRLRVQARSNDVPVEEIRTLTGSLAGVKGVLQFTAQGAFDLSPSPGGGQSFRIAELEADISSRGLRLSGQLLGDAHLTANSQGSILRTHLDSNFADSAIHGDGEWRLEGDYPGAATIAFSKLDLAKLQNRIESSSATALSRFTASAEGEIRVTGPALRPELLQAELRMPSLEIMPVSGTPGLSATSLTLRNSGPVVATLANSVITIDSARLTGRSTDLTVTGRVSPRQRNPLDLRVSGKANLGVLQTFNPDFNASGTVTTEATVRGPFTAPVVNGRIDLEDAAFSYADLPNGITNARGVILFSGDQATIQNLEGETGGGKVRLSGFAGYGGGDAVFRLHANAGAVRVRYPEGVSTVADADLDLTGTSDRSLLAGTITIRRTGLNLQSDFGSLLAKSAEPVRTPASRTGLLGGLNYDVQIQTAPDIQFESDLTQGLQADANLRLRGTVSNPALLGRINITQGQLQFFGTKYNINQGSISFYNPVKVEPVLDIDLATKARGIDITMTVSGPLSKLNVTPRSDPPLQFSEIVSVLTTGQSPTSDPTRIGQQAAVTQPYQQTAATALLGQVIANPVSGRLQRFFGISKLKIDPTLLTGVQYNPQARLTLEQQVTPELTFTYITNVTSANPQVVSVEWSVSKQWSVVGMREENGLVGLDFFFKKRFK